MGGKIRRLSRAYSLDDVNGPSTQEHNSTRMRCRSNVSLALRFAEFKSGNSACPWIAGLRTRYNLDALRFEIAGP